MHIQIIIRLVSVVDQPHRTEGEAGGSMIVSKQSADVDSVSIMAEGYSMDCSSVHNADNDDDNQSDMDTREHDEEDQDMEMQNPPMPPPLMPPPQHHLRRIRMRE